MRLSFWVKWTVTIAASGLLGSEAIAASAIKAAVMGIDTPAAWNQDVQQKLMSTGIFATVDTIEVNSSGVLPALGTLQQYDAILVYSNFQPIGSPDALGDLLAAYIDGGGGVVDMLLTGIQPTPLGGRFLASGYALMRPGLLISGVRRTTGSRLASSPILVGVSELDGGTSSFLSSGAPVDGADAPVFWDGDFTNPLALTGSPNSHNRVTLNFFPVSNDVRLDFWDSITDGARLMANSLLYVVSSPPPPCSFTLDLGGVLVPQSGATGFINVTRSDPRCSWSGHGVDLWARLIGDGEIAPPGGASINYQIDPNPGPALRTSTFIVGGQPFVVQQAGNAPPVFSLSASLAFRPVNLAFDSTVNVSSAPAGASWVAVSNSPWIQITSSGAGFGNGQVDFHVMPNPGPQRTGTLTIAGLTFTVLQGSAACIFSLDPPMAQPPFTAGQGQTQLRTNWPACPWNVTSDQPWLTVGSAPGGLGDSVIAYAVTDNPSARPRVGSLRVGTRPFPVTQDGAPVTLTINPTSANFPASGGPAVVALTASPADAPWSARSTVPWITVTPPASGTGSANIAYSVAANSSTAARTGSITIAGRPFTVTQDGASACSVQLDPTTATFNPIGGNATVRVTAPAGCPWTAVLDVNWIAVMPPNSGTGSGIVGYTVAQNVSPNPQTGHLTIGGAVLTVSQQASQIYSNSFFVTQLYRDLLNREPDPAGLAFWVGQLNGGTPRTSVALGFFNSPEFHGGGLFVTGLYLGIMGLEPDFAGWQFWYNALLGGQSKSALIQAFLNAPELQSLFAGSSDSQFTQLAYQRVLGRSPSTDELALGVAALGHGSPRADLLLSLLEGAEFNAKIQNQALATLMYVGFLRRTPEPAGLAFWIGVLNGGTSPDQVVGAFVTAPEYILRFAPPL